MKPHLYMFAIVPPAEVSARINEERVLFAEKYKCFKGLKPPVHITLYPPFNETEEFESRITPLQKWADTQYPFNLCLLNYGFFKTRVSPVVFIDVSKSSELEQLHKDFVLELRNYRSVPEAGPYHPHVTIAYRDVPKQQFPAIRNEYSAKHFDVSFIVNSLQLWKHDGENWQTQKEFKFATEVVPIHTISDGLT